MLAAGLRITPQRDLIAGVLEASTRPLSTLELCDTVQRLGSGVGRATVFRTVATLERSGIVEQLSLTGERSEYLLCSSVGHHHHLICQQCGAVSDLAEEAVEPFVDTVEEEHGFRVDHTSFTIYGTCDSCYGLT